MIRAVILALMLAGCSGFGQPPISAYMICDGNPVPKGCEGRRR